MPSWWTFDPKQLDVLLAAFSPIAAPMIAVLVWIATIGGRKALSGWLFSLEEPVKNDAIGRIKKGLTAADPNANASECVNEPVAGLDQWELARQRTNGRIAGLRRSMVACVVFLGALIGGWIAAKIGNAPQSLAQTFIVLCVLALLVIVFYGYPLFSLVMENGLPTKEALSGNTHAVPISNTVSATEAATAQSAKPSAPPPENQLAESSSQMEGRAEPPSDKRKAPLSLGSTLVATQPPTMSTDKTNSSLANQTTKGTAVLLSPGTISQVKPRKRRRT